MVPTENPYPENPDGEKASWVPEAEADKWFDSPDSPLDAQENPQGLLEVGSEPYEWLYGDSWLQSKQIQAIMDALSAAIMKNKEQFRIETRWELELLQSSLSESLRSHISSFSTNEVEEQPQPIVSQVVEDLAETSKEYSETDEVWGENDDLREGETRELTPSVSSGDMNNESWEERKPSPKWNIITTIGAFLSGLFAKINGFQSTTDHSLFNSFWRTLTPEARQSLTTKIVFISFWPIQIWNGKGQEIVTLIREKIDAGVKMQEMGKNLSEGIANAATIEDIEALIQNYEAQETPTSNEETEQNAQEVAEAEKIEKEFPFENLKVNEEKNIGIIRISQQRDEAGNHTFITRRIDGLSWKDIYAVSTGKVPDLENTTDTTSYNDLNQEEKKAVWRADLRYLLQVYWNQVKKGIFWWWFGKEIKNYSLKDIINTESWTDYSNLPWTGYAYLQKPFLRSRQAIQALGISWNDLNQTLENYVQSLNRDSTNAPTTTSTETTGSNTTTPSEGTTTSTPASLPEWTTTPNTTTQTEETETPERSA